MTGRRALATLTLAVGAMLATRAARAASCSFMTVSGAAFGSYDVFNASPTDSAANLSYICTGGATVTMTLSMGNAASYSPRLLMAGGGATLDYNLYLDAARTAIWGDGAGVTVMYGPVMPADDTIVAVPIFARIPAGQDVAIGAYSDTITVTINF